MNDRAGDRILWTPDLQWMSRETGMQRGGAERKCLEMQIQPGETGHEGQGNEDWKKNEPENRKTGKVHPTAHGVPETLTTELVVKKTREIELVGQSQAQDQVLTSATRLYVSIHAT